MSKKKEIVIKLSGGLGNQLFQFSFGQYLTTLNKNINVKYDTSFYDQLNQKYPRKLELLEFIKIEITNYSNNDLKNNIYDKLIHKIYALNIKNHLIKRFLISMYYKFSFIINENFSYGYSNDIIKRFRNNKLKGNLLFLNGYWCDYRYSKFILDQLKKDIVLKNKTNYYDICLNEITDSDVMLHVRRGDYLKIGNNAEGIFVGLSYYINAINYFKSNNYFPKSKIWIFSDDYSWCKRILKNEFPDFDFVFKSENLSDNESFQLMRKFSNYIIANSTFSLWSAYLSNSLSIQVIYPLSWKESYSSKGFNLIPLNNLNWIGI